MLAELNTYDWGEAFSYAGEKADSTGTQHRPQAVAGAVCETTPFSREDVVQVYGMAEGVDDGPAWVIAGRLRDGRHFYLEAFCDSSVWG